MVWNVVASRDGGEVLEETAFIYMKRIDVVRGDNTLHNMDLINRPSIVLYVCVSRYHQFTSSDIAPSEVCMLGCQLKHISNVNLGFQG
jgi:hypothetical protein